MKLQTIAAALILVSGMPIGAQEAKTPAEKATAPTVRVQVVIGRYQADKKVSSLPYMLTINTDERTHGGRATLRMGTQVPITTMSRQGPDANAPSVPTVVYKDVGTNIDCIVSALDDGRFRLELTVEDSSVVGPLAGVATTPNPNPPFRSFRVNNSLALRDGQSTEYTTATDKVSGDVWKLDVSLAVVK